jgi:recombination protein RecT
MSTEIQTQPQANKTAAMFLQRDDVKQKFKELLGNKSAGFITSVLGAVNANALLKKATPESVYMAAMMAAALDLPVNQNLGFAYIIPYKSKVKDNDGNDVWVDVAQFQMGYRGYIQLAQRTGQYKTISAAPVYEGQLISQDPLRGFEFDWKNKTSDTLIGYAAFFALINGFEKSMFMTVAELEKHGSKYSKTYSYGSSKWKTDFEAMAMKTVIKLLISKYGPLSVDTQMQKAVIADQSIIKDVDTMDVDYSDAPVHQIEEAATQADKEHDRLKQLIESCDTLPKLQKQLKHLSNYPDLQQLYLDKETQLQAK